VDIYQHHQAGFEMERTGKAEDGEAKEQPMEEEEEMRETGLNWKQSMERLPKGLMPPRGERV